VLSQFVRSNSHRRYSMQVVVNHSIRTMLALPVERLLGERRPPSSTQRALSMSPDSSRSTSSDMSIDSSNNNNDKGEVRPASIGLSICTTTTDKGAPAKEGGNRYTSSVKGEFSPKGSPLNENLHQESSSSSEIKIEKDDEDELVIVEEADDNNSLCNNNSTCCEQRNNNNTESVNSLEEPPQKKMKLEETKRSHGSELNNNSNSTTTTTIRNAHKTLSFGATARFSISDILRPDFGRIAILQSHEGELLMGNRRHRRKSQASESSQDNGSCNSSRRPSRPSSIKNHSEDSNSSTCTTTSTSTRGGNEVVDDSKVNPAVPAGPLLWPAWVYCTRYSDRPSSGEKNIFLLV